MSDDQVHFACEVFVSKSLLEEAEANDQVVRLAGEHAAQAIESQVRRYIEENSGIPDPD